jgi:hypothetical protein
MLAHGNVTAITGQLILMIPNKSQQKQIMTNSQTNTKLAGSLK